MISNPSMLSDAELAHYAQYELGVGLSPAWQKELVARLTKLVENVPRTQFTSARQGELFEHEKRN